MDRYTFSASRVQETQHILSNMSDLLFFYRSLFLYSLCLADVAGRFKAVSLSLFCGACKFCVSFWLMKSNAGGRSGYAEMQIYNLC